MRASTLSRRGGFTLLELSIVLVIVGLLVGGIIMGQSMIRSSEVNSVASDIQKYSTAFNTFRLKYNYWPGDLPTAYDYWPSAGCTNSPAMGAAHTGCNGNGDGSIAAWSGGATNVLVENYRAWQHLSLSGIAPGSFTGVPGPGGANDDVIGTNVPETRLSGVGIRVNPVQNVTTIGSFVFMGYYPNTLQVGLDSPAGSGSYNIYLGFLTPTEAQSMDAKYDDGRPGLGKYRTMGPGSHPNCATANDPATAQYMLTYKDVACGFRVDLE